MTRSLARAIPLLLPLAALACAAGAPAPPSSPPPRPASESGHDLVAEATSCWMGGLWSDALGESGDARYAGIGRRCDGLLADVRVPLHPVLNEAGQRTTGDPYYPLRAIEAYVVDAIALEVRRRAETSSEAPHADELVALLRLTADVTRETVRARRVADVVKEAEAEHRPDPVKAAAALDAAPLLGAGQALHAILHAEVGPYTAEARTVGWLSALDRMEISDGLPKHLKIVVLAAPFSDVFGVTAPPLPEDPSEALPGGVWLAYLTSCAASAGHPVPSGARDPQNREPLAWTGVLGGFADRLRADVGRFEGSPLGDAERGVVAHLNDSIRDEREAYLAHAPADR